MILSRRCFSLYFCCISELELRKINNLDLIAFPARVRARVDDEEAAQSCPRAV